MLKKVALFALALAVVGTAVPAQAQTVEELQAQIAALLSQIQALQAQLNSGSTGGSTASYTYNQNLTVGSEGADVTALQQFLFEKGYLKVNPTGYFGPLTKAALASYQASVGISPAVRYFGPITRAHFNSMAVVTPTPTTTATPTPTTTPTPTPSGTEGIMTVELNPSPAAGTKVYEGDTDVAVLGIKIKAQNSDINVERVKVKIGTAITAYTKQFSALAIYDGSSLLAKKDLNSSSVIKEGSDYYVYFTGLNYNVPKDTTKVLTVKADMHSVIESTYRGTATLYVPENGVRGMDGAGINQYGPSTAISRSVNINNDLASSATLTVSKNPNSPDSNYIVSDSQGDIDEATVLAFDLKSEDGLVEIDVLNVTFSGTANETVAYLYDGSTLLGSASVSNDSATFTDLQDILEVAKDSTKTLTIKVDYNTVGATASSTTATVTGANMTAYNSEGGSVVPSSSAVSDTMYTVNAAPIFSLSRASASYSEPTYSGATGTLSGSFTFSIAAQGGDIYIASSTLGAFQIDYVGSSAIAVATSSISYLQPAGVTTSGGFYKIAENTSATFTVNAAVSGPITGAYYHFVMDNVHWNTSAAVGGSVADFLDETFKTNSVYAN